MNALDRCRARSTKAQKKQAKAWSWVRGVSNHERKGRMNGFLGKEMNGAKTKE